jgi:hypothetical protein
MAACCQQPAVDYFSLTRTPRQQVSGTLLYSPCNITVVSKLERQVIDVHQRSSLYPGRLRMSSPQWSETYLHHVHSPDAGKDY